jgi:hypothetical protein
MGKINDKVNNKTERIKVEKVFNKQAFVVCVLVFLLVALYFGGHIWTVATRASAELVPVTLGSIDRTTLHEGVIIRSERVFTAGADGVPVREVDEGARVRVGDLVCGIHDAETVSQLNEQLAAMNRQTIDMQGFRGELSLVEEEAQRMNARMAMTINEHSFGLNADNINNIYGLRNNIEVVFEERNELILNESRGVLGGNAALRAHYGALLQQAKYEMRADASGVVTFLLDGMEDILTEGRLGNLTNEMTRQKVPNAAPVAGSVRYGAPVFKVITSNTWHIVSYMSRADTAGWTEGMRKDIYIQRGNAFVRLETRVGVLEDTEFHSYVVFTTNSRMLEFIDMRSVSFRLGENVAEGFRIPNAAIAELTLFSVPNGCITNTHNIDRITVVGPNRRETVVQVAVISAEEEYSLVKVDHNQLRLGDLLVDAGTGGLREVTETRVSRGVYIGNSGSAEYREVNMEGSVRGAEYTILCRLVNRNLRIGDNIIADVRNVEHRQLVN